MCHINYTLSVTTRITHQPSVCSKTLRQVAVDAFCWTQDPSSILITNHTMYCSEEHQKCFLFFCQIMPNKLPLLLRNGFTALPCSPSSTLDKTHQLCDVGDCVWCLLLLSNFFFIFLTLHSFISHARCLIVILLKKAKNKQTNKKQPNKVSPTFSAAFGSIRCFLGIRKNGWQSGCGDKRSSFRRADETRRKVEMCCWQRWITVVE